MNGALTESTLPSGLHPKVRHDLRSFVLAALPIWKGFAETDPFRYEIPTGDTSSRFEIGFKRGYRAEVELLSIQPPLKSLEQVSVSIAQYHPQLIEWVGTSTMAYRPREHSLPLALLSEVAASHSGNAEETLDRALDQVDIEMREKTVQVLVIAFLGYILAPELTAPLSFSRDVELHKLSEGEIKRYSSRPIHSLEFAGLPRSLRQALVVRAKLPLVIGHGTGPTAPDAVTTALDSINFVQGGLNLLGNGGVPILYATEIYDSPLLVDLGNRTYPTFGSPWVGGLQIQPSEFAFAQLLVSQLDKVKRPQIKFATGRLRDSELRQLSIDSLVDAVIGIEALLNPKASDEITFRMSLNYAFLGPNATAHERFKLLRDLYRVRSKIVHGAHSIDNATKFPVAGEHLLLADAALKSRDVLRDIIKRFLIEDELGGDEPLSAEFWEKRYFNVRRPDAS